MNPKKVHIQISILDIAVLLANLHDARTDERFGHMDADQDLKKLTNRLSQRRYRVPLDAIESAVAVCNFRNEVDEFWHAEDKTLTQFLVDLGVEMDRAYNTIKLME
jgi:hypothetical protein